jgi:hypothetical protein
MTVFRYNPNPERRKYGPLIVPVHHLFELAVDDKENQQDQHCDNSNGDHPIRSHPK